MKATTRTVPWSLYFGPTWVGCLSKIPIWPDILPMTATRVILFAIPSTGGSSVTLCGLRSRSRRCILGSVFWSKYCSVGRPVMPFSLVPASGCGASLSEHFWCGMLRGAVIHFLTYLVTEIMKPTTIAATTRWVAVITSGEGWHNNHHADPNSATNQRRWWEIDLTYLFLRGLALVGLAWDVQLPKRWHACKLTA